MQMTLESIIRRWSRTIHDLLIPAETTICSFPASSCSNVVVWANAMSRTSTQAKAPVNTSPPQFVLLMTWLYHAEQEDWSSPTVFTGCRLCYTIVRHEGTKIVHGPLTYPNHLSNQRLTRAYPKWTMRAYPMPGIQNRETPLDRSLVGSIKIPRNWRPWIFGTDHTYGRNRLTLLSPGRVAVSPPGRHILPHHLTLLDCYSVPILLHKDLVCYWSRCDRCG